MFFGRNNNKLLRSAVSKIKVALVSANHKKVIHIYVLRSLQLTDQIKINFAKYFLNYNREFDDTYLKQSVIGQISLLASNQQLTRFSRKNVNFPNKFQFQRCRKKSANYFVIILKKATMVEDLEIKDESLGVLIKLSLLSIWQLLKKSTLCTRIFRLDIVHLQNFSLTF